MRSLNKAEEPDSPASSPDSPAASPGTPAASPGCTPQNAEAPSCVIPPSATSKQPLYSVQAQGSSTSRSQPPSPLSAAGQKGASSGSAGGSVPLFMQRGNAKGLTLKCVNLTASHLQVNHTEKFMTPFIETISMTEL